MAWEWVWWVLVGVGGRLGMPLTVLIRSLHLSLLQVEVAERVRCLLPGHLVDPAEVA